MTQLSDEFLLAYLDGQLEKGQAAQVAQLANVNPDISRRLKRLKKTQAQILETFGNFAREDIAVPNTFAQTKSEKKTSDVSGQKKHAKARESKGGFGQVVFVGAVFLSGIVGGYGATVVMNQRPHLVNKDLDRPPAALIPPAGWSSDILRFHSYFPRETLTPYPDAIANPDLIGFQLSKVTAKGIKAPDFSHQGYALYRGQTFYYRQDRMMQLTYASKTEPPLTLYVLPASDLGDSGVTVQSVGSSKAVTWITDKIRFLLTGEKPEEDLKVLAALAQSQMPKKP